MKSRKHIVALFLALLLFLAVSVILNFYLFNFSRQYYLQLNSLRLDPLGLDYFPRETFQFENSSSDTEIVVFFGDSRAAEWPVPSINGFEFANRGIGAQTSTQVIQRYDAHVKPLNPDLIVVQVCINDLKTIPLFPERQTAIIIQCKENIQQIVQRARMQGTTVILCTIFPVGEFPIERRLFWSEDILQAVNEVNSFIKSLEGEQVIIFDSFSILADEKDRLADEYSRDELHLNPAGYEVINQEFVELLKSLGE